MRDNICEAGHVVLAESLALALADTIALDEAQSLVRQAAREARDSRESLVTAVRRAAEARGLGTGIDWDHLADPSAYLGATNELIDRIVDEAKRTVL